MPYAQSLCHMKARSTSIVSEVLLDRNIMNQTNTTIVCPVGCIIELENHTLRFVTTGIIILISLLAVPSNIAIIVVIQKYLILRIAENISITVLALWDILIGIVLVPVYAVILLSAVKLGFVVHVLH